MPKKVVIPIAAIEKLISHTCDLPAKRKITSSVVMVTAIPVVFQKKSYAFSSLHHLAHSIC